MEVNRLEIDRSFIANMLSNGTSLAALTDLGRRIALSILAKGIETPEQRGMRQTFGGNEAQGYLFGKLMSPDEFWPVHATATIQR